MKKTYLFVSLIFVVLLLAIINFRTPFLRQDGGGWSLGYGSSRSFPEKMIIDAKAIYSIENLKIQNDSTVFLADPFFVKEKDSFYIFFEHQKNKNNADIGLLTSVDGKNYQYRGTVLTQKFHLSYPQVFKYRNNFYMVPESKRANAILLYKAHRFPFDWKVCDTLVPNVQLVDPSLYLSDTLNIMVATDYAKNMYVYRADSLFGKWQLHPKPIALIGTESRAGGRFFAARKGLLLPVQDFSRGYGCGLSLYRFSFQNGNYTVKREKKNFLTAEANIKEFNAGMHQLDIQRLDAAHYYYVYDGNRLNSNSKRLNLWGPLKWNYLDFKNWVVQSW